MGLSGVQRVSKFAKYLPMHGWDVTVVTARPRGYFAYDETLASDLAGSDIRVIQTRSMDPTRLFPSRAVVSMPAESRRRMVSRITHLTFVPDNKLGWYPFARRAALAAYAERPYDVVLSSAPPYTAHVVAAAVARRKRIPFVLDFRDDWLGNPRHDYPTPLHRRFHERLERRVIETAAACVTINRVIADSLRERALAYGVDPNVKVIPQGFDPADFHPRNQIVRRGGRIMRFLYSGVFYDAQTPDPFLTGLQLALENDPAMRTSIRAEFVGLVPHDFNGLVESRGLSDVVAHHGYRTHDEVVARMKDADVLWLTIGRRTGSEGISTGKLYEYFGSRKPILGLVPPGVAREDIVAYGSSEIAEPDDPADIARAIRGLYESWTKGDADVPHEEFVEQFDRRRLAGQLAKVLDSVSVPGRGQ